MYHPQKKLSKQKHPEDPALSFEQVRDWVKIEIILHLLEDQFDIDDFVLSGIIKDHFTLHNFHDRFLMLKYFKMYWKNLILIASPFKDQNSYAPLNLVALYYGVQPAYYLAFTIVVATWLVPIVFLSVI